MNFATSTQVGGVELPDRPPVARLLIWGLAALTLGFFGLGGWAAYAPLSSAAVAVGTIVVDGSRKVVQHLEGGLITELHVREGDRVLPGQLLMRLDDLEARALWEMLEAEYLALTAQEARLQAERELLSTLVFPAVLAERHHRRDVAELLEREARIFESGRDALRGEIEVIGQRVAQLEAQIAALQAQIDAGREQLGYLEEEVSGVAALYAKGLERKPRVLALKRTQAFLKGQQGEYASRIAEAKEGIAEAVLQVLTAKRERIERAAVELGAIAIRRAQVQERLAEAGVKLARRQVVAPISGTVLNLRYHTVGGVVEPATEILEIVPTEDLLVAETRISPNDIDVVQVGLKARVVLTAYKRRTTPQIDGEVLQVSADAIWDERGKEAYFIARVGIDGRELAKLDGVRLTPGMPVEVFIRTGDRSILDYMIQPLTDSFRRAFREG
ncbi:MAG: HlyD family type I secretion periplasmic adaptor subunit [Bacteroidota bacterium]